MKNIKYIALMAIGLVACEPELDNSIEDSGTYSSGTADFSKFVTVGNSLTAGYADGTVYLQGQKNSYPNILASKFSFAGGGTFKQPLVNDNLGGLVAGPVQITDTRLVLSGDPLAPTNIPGTPTTDATDVKTGPFNNVGVPGAKSFHLLSNTYGEASGILTGTANPYFVRMASSPSATMIGDAVAQSPTFFSLWIGNNDILSFATSGGVGVDQTGNLNPATYGSNDITDPTLFHGTYDILLNGGNGFTGLTENGAKGVVMNLPSVTSIPYFTTVPYNPIPMDAPTAGGANAAYAPYNGGLAMAAGGSLITATEMQQRTITFAAGQNPVVIEDESLTDLTAMGLPSIRMATANDFIVLPSSSVIGTLAVPGDPTTVIGVGVPLNDSQALTENEAGMIAAAQAAYNNSIAMLAAANDDVILVDVKSALEQLANGGISYNGGMITDTYATGGGFSLDGVHPTARGYAVISNIIIDAIEDNFGANLPKADPGTYPTVYID
ncbi:MAG: G-D-S-L family lipolytic protein [Flavobacteriaceae bacterium]